MQEEIIQTCSNRIIALETTSSAASPFIYTGEKYVCLFVYADHLMLTMRI